MSRRIRFGIRVGGYMVEWYISRGSEVLREKGDGCYVALVDVGAQGGKRRTWVGMDSLRLCPLVVLCGYSCRVSIAI
jgi:hypothetical protein